MKIYNAKKIILKEFFQEEQSIVEKLKKRKNRFYKLMSEEGFVSVGEGESRKVFKKSNFPFVIKIAKNEEGYKANKKEIEIGTGKRGLGKRYSDLRDIMPDLYSYDESEKPKWVIFEEVKVIKDCSDSELYRLFPILSALIKKDRLNREKFIMFLYCVINIFIEEKINKNKQNDIQNGERFISWLENFLYENKKITQNEEETKSNLFIEEDINKKVMDVLEDNKLKGEFEFFYKASNFELSTLHNIGIKHSKSIDYNDLVILDAGVYE